MSLLEENHRYSYSQLASFNECPYGFYLARIEKCPTVNNGFAEQGTLIHELIDLWAKGQIPAKDLPKEYDKRYKDAVVTAFPRMLASKGYVEKTYQQGLEYFENFDEFKGYKIISTEKSYQSDIAGRPFIGIVDMVLEDNKTGEVVICDHKSKSYSSFKKSEDEMYRQQFLYAKLVYENLNIWPERLMFNLFKENGLKVERLFSKDQYHEVLKWAEDTILQIESFDLIDWLDTKKQDFYCLELCSVRKQCDNGKWTKKRR